MTNTLTHLGSVNILNRQVGTRTRDLKLAGVEARVWDWSFYNQSLRMQVERGQLVPLNKLETSRFGSGADPEQAKQQVSAVVSLKDFSARSKVSAFPGSRLWNSHSTQLSALAPRPVLTPSLFITSSSTRPRSRLSICCGPPGSEIRLLSACDWAGQLF